MCFKCGDKYFPGHQCKVKVQMLLGQEELMSEEISVDKGESVTQVSEGEVVTEEAIVSMHVTSSNPQISTMRFKGQIGNTLVIALVDSESTHIFIDPVVLKGQKCNIVATNPMTVMVANRERMATNSKCALIKFTIQGQKCTGELKLLQIRGYDIILGLDWLSKLGPMKIDWRNKWFERDGNPVNLHVQEENELITMCVMEWS